MSTPLRNICRCWIRLTWENLKLVSIWFSPQTTVTLCVVDLTHRLANCSQLSANFMSDAICNLISFKYLYFQWANRKNVTTPFGEVRLWEVTKNPLVQFVRTAIRHFVVADFYIDFPSVHRYQRILCHTLGGQNSWAVVRALVDSNTSRWCYLF